MDYPTDFLLYFRTCLLDFSQFSASNPWSICSCSWVAWGTIKGHYLDTFDKSSWVVVGRNVRRKDFRLFPAFLNIRQEPSSIQSVLQLFALIKSLPVPPYSDTFFANDEKLTQTNRRAADCRAVGPEKVVVSENHSLRKSVCRPVFPCLVGKKNSKTKAKGWLDMQAFICLIHILAVWMANPSLRWGCRATPVVVLELTSPGAGLTFVFPGSL